MPGKTKVVTAWISRRDAIVASGLTQNTFEQRLRIRIRESEIRQKGRSIEILLSAFVRAVVEDATSRTRRVADELDDESIDSPALEEGRRIKNDLLRMDRDERTRMLVNRAEVTEGIARALIPIKRTVERLQQAHGATVADIFNQSIDEAESTVALYFRELSDADADRSDDSRDDPADSAQDAVGVTSPAAPVDLQVRGGGVRHPGRAVQGDEVQGRPKPLGRRVAPRD